MNFENAELMKTPFANYLARLYQLMPGGNIDVVTAALGQTSRINCWRIFRMDQKLLKNPKLKYYPVGI